MNFLVYTTFFICSQVSLPCAISCECKVVFCSVLRRVYVEGEFIVQSQKTRNLVGHVKTKGNW